MRCEEFKENLLDYIASPPGQDGAGHARECAACAAELASLRRTMSVLDEWQAPEPSPYFATRLQARLREESALSGARGWRGRMAGLFHQVRVPVLAGVLGAAVLGGVSLYHYSEPADHSGSAQVSAVKDLQNLDNNYDLIQDLDSLDDSSAQASDVGL